MIRATAIRPLRAGKHNSIKFYSSSSNDLSPYDSRKYGHHLPCDSTCPPFECLHGMPSGVFRRTEGEKLGPGADKCGCYKNPEYFSFNHMTFYDIHMCLRPCRKPSADTGRKP